MNNKWRGFNGPITAADAPTLAVADYVIYPRWRVRGRRFVHLIGADGSTPLCGVRLSERYWDIGVSVPLPICQRCLARSKETR
jgi:hypothetical protein